MNKQGSWQLRTLQGLEGVGIQVESGNLDLEPEAEETFRKSTYRRVEQLLRGGNIPVLPSFEEMVLSASGGLLTVAASVQRRAGTDLVALTLYTELTQTVRLARTDQLSPAVTWRMVGTALVPHEQRDESIIEGIRTQVRLFLQDFAAAQRPDEEA